MGLIYVNIHGISMSRVFEPTEIYIRILHRENIVFTLLIVKLLKYLIQKERTLEALYIQHLKAGTSIVANTSEAQSPESKKDLINKFSISLKESRETDYWLNVFSRTEIITESECASLIKDCDEIERLLTSSIKTARGI